MPQKVPQINRAKQARIKMSKGRKSEKGLRITLIFGPDACKIV